MAKGDMDPRLGQTNGSGMKSSFGNGMYQSQMPQKQENRFVRPMNKNNPSIGGNQGLNNFMQGQPGAGIPGGLPNAYGPSQMMNGIPDQFKAGVPSPGLPPYQQPQNYGNDMRAQIQPQPEMQAQMPQAGSLPPMPQMGGFRAQQGSEFLNDPRMRRF